MKLRNKITSLLFISCLLGCGDYQFERSMNEYVRPEEAIGVVTKKFIDTAHRMTPKVTLNDSYEYHVYAYEAWDYIEIGDSLIKLKGSLKHTVIRKGVGEKDFYPKVNGQDLE